MSRRVVFSLALSVFLLSSLGAAFEVQRVGASGTIYIRADGRIDPSIANITTADNVTYIFTDDNYDSIVVERDNILLDGQGYLLQGPGSGEGITLPGRSNVTLRNIEIVAFNIGVWIHCSSNNTVSGNNITDSGDGVHADSSYSIEISGNNITDNFIHGIITTNSSHIHISNNTIANNRDDGIHISGSSRNTVFNNTIADNGYNPVIEEWIHYSLAGIPQEPPPTPPITGDGISLLWSNDARICDNVIVANSSAAGIFLWNYGANESGCNTVSRNIIANCENGVILRCSHDNTISRNVLRENAFGVSLMPTGGPAGFGSHSNVIFRNTMENNSVGILITQASSSNVIFHNNFINNTEQALPNISDNYWNSTYFFNGTHRSGGNFWSDYSGVDLYHGISQDIPGSDGMGDAPHVIDAYNVDHYPLLNVGWPPSKAFLLSPNGGECWSGTQTINWTSSTDPDGDSLTYDIEYSLDSGGNWSLLVQGVLEASYVWNTSIYPDSGNYLLRVRANDGVLVSEWDESDGTFTVDNEPSETHDVAILEVSTSKTAVGEGYSMCINVTIENQGDFPESFNVTIYANSSVIHKTNSSLASGNLTEVSFVWSTAEALLGKHIIRAVADTVVGENDTADNSLAAEQEVCVTIPGDVDGDCDVDIYDIVLMSGAYGSKEGEQRFIANCDIDGDGDVDIHDISIAADNYMESW